MIPRASSIPNNTSYYSNGVNIIQKYQLITSKKIKSKPEISLKLFPISKLFQKFYFKYKFRYYLNCLSLSTGYSSYQMQFHIIAFGAVQSSSSLLISCSK